MICTFKGGPQDGLSLNIEETKVYQYFDCSFRKYPLKQEDTIVPYVQKILKAVYTYNGNNTYLFTGYI